MKFELTRFQDKMGRDVILRSAEIDDAEDMIRFLADTAAESRFLAREPGEVSLTVEQEVAFLQAKIESARELMLVAEVDGKHAGNCSLMCVKNFVRYRHRCELAIALYQEFCGAGIGSKMLETVLEVAKECGYEQAELEVIDGNDRAKTLYEKLGFEECGRFPDNIKYADGTYADAFWMMKKL